MKVLEKIKIVLPLLLLCTACSNEDEVFRKGEISENGINATIPAYSFEDGTRVNISDDLQTFTWSDGDQLGLYYQGSGSTAHAGFTITTGGESTGIFENEAFTLKSSATYYAFYPFNENATILSAPVDFTGQVQNGNASAAHLGGYNYMYSTVNTDATGNANIQFKNLGSVMQLQLTVSNAATYTGIDITSDGTEFITKGTASMVDGSVTATETSATIHLDFENGIALNAGDVLTANILTAPVDLSGNTLTIALTDTEGKTYEVTTAGKNMVQGKAYLYAVTIPYIGDIPYVTFTADAMQWFHIYPDVSTLEYSVNGEDWITLGSSWVQFGGDFGDLRLRGKSSIGTNESEISFSNDTKVACSGDIRTLIDYENFNTTDTGNAKFEKLFRYCTCLTQAPELPAMNLASQCYRDMFNGCISLTQAPELPATNLAELCYNRMFFNCTSLIKAPELPAVTLADHCYTCMFYNCTSLIQLPKKLPATTLAEYCYYSMFELCTSLTQAPELPATNLVDYCYLYMFRGCTSLIQAPELPATTLTKQCYFNMFLDCTSLTQVPKKLPATTLASQCYESMFGNCESLTQVPELPATNLVDSCYICMFNGCTSLTQAPELPATNLTKSCYLGMFGRCESLTQAPKLPATTLAERCYERMFSGCKSLNYIHMMSISSAPSEYYTSSWLDSTLNTGIFVKNSKSTWSGNSNIPYRWTIIYYDTDSSKYYLDQACSQECDDHGNPL